MRIPVILVVVHLVVLIILARTWYSAQPQSYMDEIFHVPQAQRYCQGDYWTWDPKLTTPPALYVISNLLLFATGQRPICSTLLLRLTNLIYPFLTLYALVGLLKELHPRLNYQERFTAAAVVICLPTLYFFNLMYYTDGGSTAFVLISWLAAKRRHHFLAALGSAVAVTFRQTNIIWSLFILGTTLLELAEPEERRHYDPKAAFIRTPLQLVNALNGFIHMLISRIPIVLVISIPYFGLLTAFATFVKWNGGIVLGDRSNHVPTLHLAQLLYFSAFTAGLSIFAILGAVPLARLLPKFTLRY
ncbi:glucosyltransferase [Lobosporangium transversale]|nr:glucosyltransferase [Lobosporangium transversale]